jgi:osmotically-inducible protein OsmY
VRSVREGTGTRSLSGVWGSPPPSFDFKSQEPKLNFKMRLLLALIIGAALGFAAYHFYNTRDGRVTLHRTGDQIETGARNAADTVQDKLKSWNLTPDDIRADLSKGAIIVRQKSQQVGKALADSTADARITAAIKGKLVANKDLSALSISVNTTDGVVTLSGSVNSPDDISKAMVLAMDTDGVRQVVANLQLHKS